MSKAGKLLGILESSKGKLVDFKNCPFAEDNGTWMVKSGSSGSKYIKPSKYLEYSDKSDWESDVKSMGMTIKSMGNDELLGYVGSDSYAQWYKGTGVIIPSDQRR